MLVLPGERAAGVSPLQHSLAKRRARLIACPLVRGTSSHPGDQAAPGEHGGHMAPTSRSANSNAHGHRAAWLVNTHECKTRGLKGS